MKALLKAGVSLAALEPDGADNKKVKLGANTPDVSAAFVGNFDILRDIVQEMNRLNIPTRNEPVG